MVTMPVGQIVDVEGVKMSAFLFTSQEDADDFVESMMQSDDNVAAGIALLDTGTWRVVVGKHYDA